MNSSIRTKKWWSLIILIVFIVMTASVDAMAKPKTAKQLTNEGAKAFEKEDYDKALELFNEAYEKEPSTSLLYNLGRVNESKGEFEKAMSYYRDYVTAADADEDARSDALTRIEQLEKIITIKNGGSLTGNKGAVVQAPAKAAGGAKSTPSKAAAMPAGGCVDINSADEKTLTKLTGIGDAKAKQIVELRSKSGGIKNLDELTSIKGIGPGTVNKFRSQVCPPLGSGDAAAAPAAAPKAAGKAAAAPKPVKTVKPTDTGDVVDI